MTDLPRNLVPNPWGLLLDDLHDAVALLPADPAELADPHRRGRLREVLGAVVADAHDLNCWCGIAEHAPALLPLAETSSRAVPVPSTPGR